MTVALPEGYITDATPQYLDRGGLLKPSLGGPDQRLDRMGSKWGCTFTTKPMKGDDARVWIARLIRGISEKASIKFPQPGVKIPHIGPYANGSDYAANTDAFGFSYPNTADWGKPPLEGQFFTLVINGQRFLHQIKDQPVISGGIDGYLFHMQPPLKRNWNAGVTRVIEGFPPIIEGYVQNEQVEWTIDRAKIYGLQFTIIEAE